MYLRLLLLFAFVPLSGCNVGSTSDLAPTELPSVTAVEASIPFNATDADARARALVVEQNWPGLSIAMGWKGELVWAHSVGFANILEEQPMTPDTRIRIGSVSQAITGTLIATLAQEELVDLDTPIRHYMPTLPSQYAEVTTRSLMTHTAGVRHHKGESEFLRRFACEDADAQLAVFINDRLLHESQKAVAYSVYGWVLAGAIAESATNADYLALLDRQVLKPLNMTRTSAREKTGDAMLYWPFMATTTSYGLEAASETNLSCVIPGEGLISTPTDLVRLGNALLTDNLLEVDRARELYTPGRLHDGSPINYGLGWYKRNIEVNGKQIAVYSSGGYPDGVRWAGPGVAGGTASVILVPEYELVIATATNVTFARELTQFNLDIIKSFISDRSHLATL